MSSVNDAPVLSGASDFGTITEDDLNNSGDLVSSLVSGKITDVDSSAVQGIAVTGLNSSTGTWQFSIDNGQTWAGVGSASATSALLLRSSDKLRFVPDGKNDHGEPDVCRLGSTSGTAGQTGDVSTPGGTSDFSTASATSSITVTNLNDAPVITGANDFTTITEDDSNNNGDAVSALISGQITDVDTIALQGIAVTSVVSSTGNWQFSLDNGQSWNDVGSVSDSSADRYSRAIGCDSFRMDWTVQPPSSLSSRGIKPAAQTATGSTPRPLAASARLAQRLARAASP